MSARPTRTPGLYENPELWRWAGSMEGIPDWLDPAETQQERADRANWQQRGNDLLAWLGELLPGLAIALALAVLGRIGAQQFGDSLGLDRSPLSPILLAILLGLLVRNTLGMPQAYERGLQLCLSRLLRIGVALLGFRLSLSALGSIGLFAVPIALGSIVAALVLVTLVSKRVGVPTRLGTLIAVGTAICGNSAIVATAPVIGATEDETSYAVGTITAFGLLALVTYPFIAHTIFGGNSQFAGYFLGTAIHDTAQVAGAGLLYMQQFAAPEALETATVTKLVRNLFMLAVIPLMAFIHHRAEGTAAQQPSFRQLVPVFVFGFVACALVRTLGDLGDRPLFGLASPEFWQDSIGFVSNLSAWLLTIAMASVGLGTHLRRLRSLGLRPIAVGFSAALIVGVVSATLIRLLSPWIPVV